LIFGGLVNNITSFDFGWWILIFLRGTASSFIFYLDGIWWFWDCLFFFCLFFDYYLGLLCIGYVFFWFDVDLLLAFLFFYLLINEFGDVSSFWFVCWFLIWGIWGFLLIWLIGLYYGGMIFFLCPSYWIFDGWMGYDFMLWLFGADWIFWDLFFWIFFIWFYLLFLMILLGFFWFGVIWDFMMDWFWFLICWFEILIVILVFDKIFFFFFFFGFFFFFVMMDLLLVLIDLWIMAAWFGSFFIWNFLVLYELDGVWGYWFFDDDDLILWIFFDDWLYIFIFWRFFFFWMNLAPWFGDYCDWCVFFFQDFFYMWHYWFAGDLGLYLMILIGRGILIIFWDDWLIFWLMAICLFWIRWFLIFWILCGDWIGDEPHALVSTGIILIWDDMIYGEDFHPTQATGISSDHHLLISYLRYPPTLSLTLPHYFDSP